MRHGFRRAGDHDTDERLLRLQALPCRIHVVDAAAPELRGVDERVDGKQIGGVVLDDVALHPVAVFLLRLPIVGPRARPLELFLVIDERRVLQGVRRAAARRDYLPGLVPEMAQVRHVALGELLEQAFFDAEDDFGRRQQPGHVEARRAARGTDLGVVLGGGAGGVVDHFHAEFLLERPDDDALDQLLVLAALCVDDQRLFGARGNHVRRRHGGGRALQQPAA